MEETMTPDVAEDDSDFSILGTFQPFWQVNRFMPRSRRFCQFMRYLPSVGEVGGMPKLGQSRKSRLRRHGKEWKKSVHGDLEL